jgi:hypothetical protein
MRILLLLLLAVGLAGCTTSPKSASAPSETIVVRPAFEKDLPRRPARVLAGLSDISPLTGMSETDVMRTFGAGRDRSTPGLWVYWGYYSAAEAAQHGGDTLVLAFKRGRVTGAKLVRGDLLRVHLEDKRPSAVTAKL